MIDKQNIAHGPVARYKGSSSGSLKGKDRACESDMQELRNSDEPGPEPPGL